MPPRVPRTLWQRCRIWFRRFRIAVWLLALVLVCAGLYVNQIGLPDFMKRRLLEPLRESWNQIARGDKPAATAPAAAAAGGLSVSA